MQANSIIRLSGISNHIISRDIALKPVTLKVNKTTGPKNELQTNQSLLERLRSLQVKDQREIVIKKSQPSDAEIERVLTFVGLNKLIKLYLKDPLMWDSRILGKIFGIQENICESLVRFVQPMVYRADSTMSKPEQIVEQRFIVDVKRLKEDENYLAKRKNVRMITLGQQKLDVLAADEQIENDYPKLS